MTIKLIDFFIDELNYGCKLIQYSMTKYLQENYGCNVVTYDTRDVLNWTGVGNFNDFDEMFLTTKKIQSLSDIVLDNETTDFFVFPGDQIWNFDCRKNNPFFTQFFTLPFIPKEKKIAYSVSDNNWFMKTAENGNIGNEYGWYLREIGSISVREQKTNDFLCKNGIESTVNIDSVFLLSQDEWRKLQNRPQDMNEDDDFDMYYFVHSSSSMVIDETRKHIVVKGNIGGVGRKYSVQEFLWLCSHCKTLYTNSFHGMCFGIMFNRRIVSPNMKWDYRMSQLKSILNIDIVDGIITNHESVMKNIETLRGKAKQFFDSIIGKKSIQVGKKFACYCKNPTWRELSTSGGFCGISASHVINERGVVYGASYIDGFRHVKTVRVDNISDYFKLISKSKYSFCQDCDFNLVKNDLESGRKVLFTGCPCQIKHLKQFLGKNYDNLITIDLLCHGYSEPKCLEQFIDGIEQDEKSKVVSLDMRSNHRCITTVVFNNGKKKEYNNEFSIFIHNNNMISMCKKCNMHNGNNVSDITVGDFWGYKKDKHPCDFSPKLGTNIVNVHTQKGLDFVNSFSTDLDILYDV